MDNVFNFRNQLIAEYSSFSRSFSIISAADISHKVNHEYNECRYWPELLIQINPNYRRNKTVQQLANEGALHTACAELFKAKKADVKQRTRAIVIYPMNVLANSQLEELGKFLHGYALGQAPLIVARYTGQESAAEPLPTQDNRLAIMFYEATEGGAGVLTRLASDTSALARVVAQALVLLHHKAPNGSWVYEDLPSLELTDKNGHHVCEAGCYQCLLSYFNQPDHDDINRRNEAALKLLVAMTTAQVVPAPVRVATRPATLAVVRPANELHQQWMQALRQAGFLLPDEEQVSVANGTAVAAGVYKQA